MPPEVRFRQSAAEEILERFGKTTDDKGYIVDKETGKRVEDPRGEEILIEDFGGIGKGSEVFVKKDFNSVAEYVESHYPFDDE